MWLELKEHLGSQEQMAYQVFQEREERQASPDNPVPPDWMVPRDHPDSQGSEAETDPQVGQGVLCGKLWAITVKPFHTFIVWEGNVVWEQTSCLNIPKIVNPYQSCQKLTDLVYTG